MHIIRQQQIEAGTENREIAMLLQDKISDMGNESIRSLLAELMDKHCPPFLHHAFRRIEFDLGTVSWHNFESEFLDRLREKANEFFRDELAALSVKSGTPQENEIWVSAFFFFMNEGHFPWWLSSDQQNDPVTMLDKMLKDHASAWSDFLYADGRRQAVQQRLVFQFREMQHIATVRTIEPSNASAILQYAENLDEVHKQKPIVPDSVHGFRQIKWLFIFHYLLAEKSSYFEAKSFLKSIVRQMAAHYGLSYRQLLYDLYLAAADVQLPSGSQSLPAVLRDVFMEELPEELPEILSEEEAGKNKLSVHHQAILYMEHFLQYGTMPALPGNFSRDQFEDRLREAIHAFPADAAAVIRTLGVQQKVRERMVQNFTESFLEDIVSLLEPANAEAVKETATAWTELRREQMNTRLDTNDFETIKWNIILAYLLVEKGSRFNRKTFLRYLVEKTAAHYNISYAALLQTLLRVFHTEKHSGSETTLVVLLREIAEEDGAKKKKEPAGLPDLLAKAGLSVPEEELLQAKLDVLSYYLEYGSIPWWGATFRHYNLSTLFREIVQKDGDRLRETLTAIIHREEVAMRLVQVIDERSVFLLMEQGTIPFHRELSHHYGTLQEQFRKQQATAAETMVFRHFVSYLFFYLLHSRVPDIGQLKKMIIRISSQQGVNAEKWMQLLSRSVVALSIPVSGHFSRIVYLLAEEFGADQAGKESETAKRPVTTDPEKEIKPKDAAAEKSGQPADVEALEQFLLTGFLPSWAGYLDTQDFKKLLEFVWNRHPDAFRRMMERVLQVPMLRKQLMEKLDAPVLYRLSGSLFPGLFPGFSMLSQDGYSFMERMLPRLSSRERLHLFWEYSFVFLSGNTVFSTRQFARGLWESILRYHQGKELAFLLEAGQKLEELSAGFSPLFQAALGYGIEELQQELHAIVEKEEEKEKPKAKSAREKEEEEDEELKKIKEVYIRNAGMVIVWPFLPHLFERLKLVKEGKFIDVAAAYRGVHLLQYIVTGQTGEPEYRLVLNKILCGVESIKPVERNIVLTDEEKAICEEMLQVLISRWEIVSNSTPEAIRESFLQREGKLTSDELANKVVVEKKGMDVLLDHLPWAISVINLSWMNKPLYVTWR